MKQKVVVIGAGAAGLMAAGQAAMRGKDVLLIDKNARPARKVMITGKGRCNVTNDCDNETFLKNVRSNPRFLYSAIAGFSTADTMAFFEGRGVPLKTERGGRVFPVSDSAADIVDALSSFASDAGVPYRTGRVARIQAGEDGVEGVVLEDGERIPCTDVILATGGQSYPGTGSSGDGYKLSKMLGHTVARIRPSLIPIETKEEFCKEMQGLSLKNVTLSVTKGKKKVYSELGEMLFTHFGVSGPLVLSASSHIDDEKMDEYRLHIDLKPGLSPEQLDARLLRDFEKYKNKDFFNSLGDLLPRKMIPVVVRLSGVEGTRKVHQITREERRGLVELIKGFAITPKAFRPLNEAIVTAGGVSVREVDPKSMQSKLCRGLYFAGEVLDLDAYTGGFNLQIAFSTGFAAGTHV
ncbi:BaiN/RdsA family NAD(P)/FAD-dependent oxidoreductase [Zongyangia hominis]|uniref:NAD(P)/FAD-dependent oxidoreductase n=1 Tax=Zongyangia hominis TaxID=2763677 RepID=A0A926E8Y7_9FIRM|nr:NAD(P)/FAD-dependent oxidoreductase [Zongyangia hominis]MBC8570080.1 NAD(P)/FAD-dependent oxidoreductase [Zongyangia hominis]